MQIHWKWTQTSVSGRDHSLIREAHGERLEQAARFPVEALLATLIMTLSVTLFRTTPFPQLVSIGQVKDKRRAVFVRVQPLPLKLVAMVRMSS